MVGKATDKRELASIAVGYAENEHAQRGFVHLPRKGGCCGRTTIAYGSPAASLASLRVKPIVANLTCWDCVLGGAGVVAANRDEEKVTEGCVSFGEV